MQAIKPLIISPTILGASREIQCFLQIRAFGDGQAPLDGLDAWGTLTQGKAAPHVEILLNSTPNTGAFRVGDWKLVLNGTVPADENAQGQEVKPAQERVELFNLANDPYEKQNLAAQQPEKVKVLRARYDKLAAQAAPPKVKAKAADFKVPKVWGEQ